MGHFASENHLKPSLQISSPLSSSFDVAPDIPSLHLWSILGFFAPDSGGCGCGKFSGSRARCQQTFQSEPRPQLTTSSLSPFLPHRHHHLSAMDILETPSRVLRRIKENDAGFDDLPDLPSVSFDDIEPSVSASITYRRSTRGLGTAKGFSESEGTSEEEDDEELPTTRQSLPVTAKPWSTPVQSTPIAGAGNRTARRQTPGSSGSRVRFANSIMTRSFGTSRVEGEQGSFDVSKISYVDAEEEGPYVENTSHERENSNSLQRSGGSSHRSSSRSASGDQFHTAKDMEEVDLNDTHEYEYSHSRSGGSAPAVYNPGDEDEIQEGLSILSALQPVSRSGSPLPGTDASRSKSFGDVETSFRSDRKVSKPYISQIEVETNRPSRVLLLIPPSGAITSLAENLFLAPNNVSRAALSLQANQRRASPPLMFDRSLFLCHGHHPPR